MIEYASVNSKKLKKLKESNNLTLDKISKATNISLTEVHWLMTKASYNPSIITMFFICNFFSITPFEFIDYKSGKTLLLSMLYELVEAKIIDYKTASEIYKHYGFKGENFVE